MRDSNETAGTPRWVKVFGIVALVMVVVIVIVFVIGRGGHGPSRHSPDGGGASVYDDVDGHIGTPAAVTHEQR